MMSCGSSHNFSPINIHDSLRNYTGFGPNWGMDRRSERIWHFSYYANNNQTHFYTVMLVLGIEM